MSNPTDDAAAEDIAELNRLVSECKRPRVKSMLELYITQLQMPSSSSAPKTAPAPGPPAPVVAPKRLPTIAAPAAPSGDDVKYVPVTAFAWDQDSYGKTPNHVYVYLMTGFEGIGECKDSVSCTFDKQAFDLKVHGFKGKNYRLFKSNLEKASNAVCMPESLASTQHLHGFSHFSLSSTFCILVHCRIASLEMRPLSSLALTGDRCFREQGDCEEEQHQGRACQDKGHIWV